jgi:hypothetical protein
VGHPAVGIHADVRVRRANGPPDRLLILLTAEIPVVALLRGGHLRIAGLGLVLGRGGRVDDRRIHKGARAQGDTLVGQIRVHLGQDRRGQPVPLQQVAEVQDRVLRACAAPLRPRSLRTIGMRSSPSSIPAKRRIASLS